MILLSKFIEYIKNSSTSFPLLVLIILIAIFITTLIIIINTLVTVKKQKIVIPPSALNSNIVSNINRSKIKTNNINPFLWLLSEKLNKFLIKKGYIKSNRIIVSFFNATIYLTKTLGIKNKYFLPWFIIVGASESGKSSLLNGFTHDELYEDGKENDPCTWWFLKNGIVFDIKGDIFVGQKELTNNEVAWNTILNMLHRYRGKKPINGIILSISAAEFYGKNKFTLDEIKKRALYISRKLNFCQLYLGIKLPIYLVITKTDIIPGFQSFCAELPVRNRGNMLGWSSPFTLDTIYNPAMLDQAFEDLENYLHEIRMEIFSENLISSMKDGVFVFPSELLTIKESLSCFINTMFKDTSLNDTSYFRGFYFTGDSKMVPLSKISNTESEDMAIIGTPDADINEAGNISASIQDEKLAPRKIFFFEDLLLKKIFLEEGIASPMKKKLHKANKSIFIIKIIIALFVIISSYGLFNATDKLNYNKNNIYPSLSKLSSVIKESGNFNLTKLDDNGNEILSECSNQLLLLMQQIKNIKLNSIFVPSSWFSNINNELQDILKISYQKIIIRTIYINLLLKAKSLLKIQENKKSTSLLEVINPEDSKEYNQLKQYIFDLIELQQNIKKFDELCFAADPKDLNDLIKYTFNSSLPQKFLDNYKDFRSILINTSFPPLDLTPHMQVAYKVTVRLFNNFIESIFNNNNSNFISKINKFIDNLSRQNIKQFPNCSEIKKFSELLSAACKKIGKEGETWLDKDKFEFSKDFKKLMNYISSLFGNKLAEKMTLNIEDGFNTLKDQIKKINNVLDSRITNTKNKPLTANIFQLEKSLNTLCSEGFMDKPLDYELITDIPDGKMIYWDDDLVNYAIELGQRYDEFASSYINEFPKIIQEGISLITKTNLYAVISGLIAKSQSLVDAPDGLTSLITAEEILQRQVSELKGIAPKFIKLLQILRSDQFSFVFGNFRTILNKIGYSLLSNIDKLLYNQQPYMPPNLTFDFWDGKVGAGLAAYSAADMDEFNSYLQLQRNIIVRLAIDFAQTLVQFLNSEYIYDKNYSNHSQLNKWTRIVNDIESYKKKEPNNPLQKLEDFIKNTLNTYTLDNITDKIYIQDIQKDTGDYFINIINDIKRGIMARAEVLIRQRNIIRYEKLRDFYSRNLERFYPFSNYDSKQRIAKDADLDTVKEFFILYNEFGGTPEAILDQIYQLEEGKELYEFLKKIHIFKELLGDSFINQNDSIKIKIETNFNINKRDESNTEYLVDRTFKPNNYSNIESISPNKYGVWYFGEPVEFNLRWADGDTEAQRPRYDTNDPDLTINERTAKIECIGNWSLLRFLQKYKVAAVNANRTDKNQIVLCFKIPLNDNSTSKIYIGITVYKSNNTEHSPISIQIPNCPGKMPAIPDSIIALSNISVLVNKPLNNNEDAINISKKVNKRFTNKNNKSNGNNKNKKITSKQSSNKKQLSNKENSNIVNLSNEDQIDKVLNSSEVPDLKEKDAVIAVSEQPIE